MRLGKIFASAVVAATAFGAGAHTSIEDLRICRMVEPSDIVKPVFSWQMRTARQGAAQRADVLTREVERPDVAYTLLLQRKNPSWLHSVEQGATTIWERWNGYSKADGFLRLSMKSYNHYAYGAVLEWMYDTMAGIRPDPKSSGWRHFILAPRPDRRMGHVSAQFDSPYGRIESAWEYAQDGTLAWRFTVPPNSTATVHVPNGGIKEYAAGTYTVKSN